MAHFLSLLDDATRRFARSLTSYQMQMSRESDKRDASAIVDALVDLYVASEKVLKFAVQRIDEGLLIKNLDPARLRELRKMQHEACLPTLLSVPTRIESPPAKDLLVILKDITAPPIPAPVLQQYATELTDLSYVRNQVIHAELIVEPETLLEKLAQSFGRVRSVLDVLCPDLLVSVRDVNDQVDSLLTAAEKQVDGSWQVLLDYIEQKGQIEYSFDFRVVLSGEGTTRLSTGSTLFTEGVSFDVLLPPGDVDGFLAQPIDPTASRFAETIIKSREDYERAKEKYSLIFAALSGWDTVEGEGFKVPQDGTMRLRQAPGQLHARLAGYKRSTVFASVTLLDWRVIFSAGAAKGRLDGRMGSAAKSPSQSSSELLTVEGEVWLNAEYIVPDDTRTGEAPGSTVRRLNGKYRVRRQ